MRGVALPRKLSGHHLLLIGLVFLLLAVGTMVLSGCSLQLKWFGAGGPDCEWDEINYKGYRPEQLSPAAGGNEELRRQAEESMRQAEEEQKQLEFGPCSENDLAHRTCN